MKYDYKVGYLSFSPTYSNPVLGLGRAANLSMTNGQTGTPLSLPPLPHCHRQTVVAQVPKYNKIIEGVLGTNSIRNPTGTTTSYSQEETENEIKEIDCLCLMLGG